MVAYLDAHPEAGAVTSRMVFQDGTTSAQLLAAGDVHRPAAWLYVVWAYCSTWRERRRQSMWYADWDRESDQPGRGRAGLEPAGAPPVLEQIGYFDEQLKLYFTEDDLCCRIRQTGCEVHYVAGATIIHDEHASTSQVQRLATHVYFNDLIAFTRKYYGRARAWLLAALIMPTRTAMLIVQSLKKRR